MFVLAEVADDKVTLARPQRVKTALQQNKHTHFGITSLQRQPRCDSKEHTLVLLKNLVGKNQDAQC